MNAVRRERLVPILAVGAGLFALSVVVDSPVTEAAPMLFAGLVVLAVAVAILRVAGTSRRLFLFAGVCLLVGGLSFVHSGLATLGAVPDPGRLAIAGDAAFVVGLVAFARVRGLFGR